MGRNLILGDVHSRYEKLMKVLDKASYDPSSDNLFALGDFCDRGFDAVKTLRFFMGVENLRAVKGNHDTYLEAWLGGKEIFPYWRQDGGGMTIADIRYRYNIEKEELDAILSFLKHLPAVRVEGEYILSHGGLPYFVTLEDILEYDRLFKKHEALSEEMNRFYIWDRGYIMSALSEVHTDLKGDITNLRQPLDTKGKRIFLGHTPTFDGKPFISKKYNLVALDTGAGYDGPLTLMDMDTLEYYQA